MINLFLTKIDDNIVISDDYTTKETIFNEYERVILDSLLQTFGLDFIIQDQYGGDVDTIHNLEQVRKDKNINIKNEKTLFQYNNRGNYDSHLYHSDKEYKRINHMYSRHRKEIGINDAYTGNILYDSHDLDHIISAKSIHDNAAIYATSLNPVVLVNSEDNLVPTISVINRSKGAKDVEEFLESWNSTRILRQNKIKELYSKEILTIDEKKKLKKYEELERLKPNQMRKLYNSSIQSMRNKLNKDYYYSNRFLLDTSKAAGILGSKIAIKQAIGFILLEVWYSVKEKIRLCNSNTLKVYFVEIIEGIKDGFKNAKSKYQEIILKLKDGMITGIISSLTTTLTNIFKTLMTNSIKIMRNICSALVQSFKILFFQNHKSWQEKIHAILVLLSTAAASTIGILLGSYLSPILSTIPFIGDLLVTFTELFVSGILSCTFIYFIDKGNLSKKILEYISKLTIDPFSEHVDYLKNQVLLYEEYVAKLMSVDIELLKLEINKYNRVLNILQGDNIIEINTKLKEILSELDIKLPWTDDFNTFMGDRKNQLVFEL